MVHGEKPNDKLLVARASRELDLTSHVLEQTIAMTVQNEGDSPVTTVLYLIDNGLKQHLAYIQALVKRYAILFQCQCIFSR